MRSGQGGCHDALFLFACPLLLEKDNDAQNVRAALPCLPGHMQVRDWLVQKNWTYATKSTEVVCCACHLSEESCGVGEDGNLKLKEGAEAQTQQGLKISAPIDPLKTTRNNSQKTTNPDAHAARVKDVCRMRAEEETKAAAAAAAATNAQAEARADAAAEAHADVSSERDALCELTQALQSKLRIANKTIDELAGAASGLEENLHQKDQHISSLVADFEAACIRERRALTSAQLHAQMVDELADLNAEAAAERDSLIERCSAQGAAVVRKNLVSAYLKYWSRKADGADEPRLSLEAVKLICAEAGAPEEYARVEGFCGPVKYRKGDEQSGPTPAYTNKVKRVAACFANALEVSSQRANVMQKSTGLTVGKVSGATKRFMAGTGATASVSTVAETRRKTVLAYHALLEERQRLWVEEMDANRDGILVGWLDDYTSFEVPGCLRARARAPCSLRTRPQQGHDMCAPLWPFAARRHTGP